jgi:hypothetical protein
MNKALGDLSCGNGFSIRSQTKNKKKGGNLKGRRPFL